MKSRFLLYSAKLPLNGQSGSLIAKRMTACSIHVCKDTVVTVQLRLGVADRHWTERECKRARSRGRTHCLCRRCRSRRPRSTRCTRRPRSGRRGSGPCRGTRWTRPPGRPRPAARSCACSAALEEEEEEETLFGRRSRGGIRTTFGSRRSWGGLTPRRRLSGCGGACAGGDVGAPADEDGHSDTIHSVWFT